MNSQNDQENQVNAEDANLILKNLKQQAKTDQVRVTQHAHREMVEDGFKLDEVLSTIIDGEILENYPTHRRGACCLMYGKTQTGRDVHIVCTTTQPTLIIITVYEPTSPKWISATQRRSTT